MGSLSQCSYFLQSDGTVKYCGSNMYCQGGTGDSVSPKPIITTISNLTNVAKIAPGNENSLFLLKDGTVKVCGKNSRGQCGTGSTGNYISSIVSASGLLTDVAQISAGNGYTLFLLKDGTVKSCGHNGSGQCGTGDMTTPKSSLATTIPNLIDVAQISAGDGHTLFLLKDGTVKSCGYNSSGQCGTGNTTTPKLNISLIPELSNVIQIEAGYQHSLFLLKDGTVKSCGLNNDGQCGTGNTTTPKLSLAAIPDLANVVQIAAGETHSLFLLKDGTVKSCGNNSLSQCGTGNQTSPKLNVSTISGLSNVARISTGYRHSLFLLKDGTVKSCGNNYDGQCGTGDIVTPKLSTATIPSLNATDLQSSIFAIAAITPEEQVIIDLNTDTVTAAEINTAINLLAISAPTYYTSNTQDAIALLMPKLGDSDFTDYTEANFESRLTTATNTAKNNAKPSILAALNTDTVTVSEVNTAISIFDITPPINYTINLQNAVALLMPKTGDVDFTDYTEANFESRLIAATNMAKEKELALAALNTGIVIPDKVNTAITLFDVKAPKKYTHRSQKAIAEHMPKKEDPDFTDYTPENFQARLDAATEKAEKKHKETKSFYNFLSKLPSMKI